MEKLIVPKSDISRIKYADDVTIFYTKKYFYICIKDTEQDWNNGEAFLLTLAPAREV